MVRDSFLTYRHYFLIKIKNMVLSLLLLQPDREDELLRIEGEGGKVIKWNGARVFGVLAMSRAIGFHLYSLFHLHSPLHSHLHYFTRIEILVKF